ncbi:hypothetical protein M413DRAFT_443341 [Hebeloma cylindrosporum]|uniref:F-box domain-containing protein n=1 Tax=Hebeloma cylindrosporum TaxID=76867 RepID=A0A0C3C638_HEBCY|nr:hypothetical protein M413DRAFT_443341 [Hebeloma cylindrosporum h7]
MGELEQSESRLLSLAPELIQAISDELTIDTAKDLRLTCKQFGEFLHPRIFRDLTINFTQATYENDLFKVRLLAATDFHATSTETRTLKITSLSPAYDPGYSGPGWTSSDDGWIKGPEREDPPEVKVAEEELKGYLFKAIASLRSLESVELTPGRKDGEWAHKDAMNALETLPNLRVLSIYDADLFKFPLPLHNLSSIEEISASGISVQYTPRILDNIAKLVARSPKITSISMTSSSYWSSGDECPSLHDIFKHYPQSFPPLRLRRLLLMSYRIKLDDLTLPHLRHLTSLDLRNIEEPYNRRRRRPWEGPSGLNHAEEIQRSTLDDIWKMMKISGIYLQELALDVVVPSFLEYLASYSGLKKLCIVAGGFNSGYSSDSMARQFFSTPFINHVQSLEDLTIRAPYEGSWCFGRWNQAIVSSCKNLKKLEMAIVSARLHEFERNVIGLIDTVSKSMPQLDSLIISTATPESDRGAWCGNGAMEHSAYTARRIILSVNKYRSLPTCRRLPHLTVEDDPPRTFIPIGPDEDGRLHYTNTNPPSHNKHYPSQDDDYSSQDDNHSSQDDNYSSQNDNHSSQDNNHSSQDDDHSYLDDEHSSLDDYYSSLDDDYSSLDDDYPIIPPYPTIPPWDDDPSSLYHRPFY